MARVPPGKTIGNRRRERGTGACNSGYNLGSFKVGCGGKGGSEIGAYVVVVVVVVVTLEGRWDSMIINTTKDALKASGGRIYSHSSLFSWPKDYLWTLMGNMGVMHLLKTSR